MRLPELFPLRVSRRIYTLLALLIIGSSFVQAYFTYRSYLANEVEMMGVPGDVGMQISPLDEPLLDPLQPSGDFTGLALIDEGMESSWKSEVIGSQYHLAFIQALKVLTSGFGILALALAGTWYVLYRFRKDIGQFALAVSKGSAEPTNYLPELQPLLDEVKRQRRHSDSILDASVDLMCVVDSNGRLVQANRAFEEVLGYSSPEIQDIFVHRLIHPEDLESLREEVVKVRLGDKSLGVECRLRCKDGSYKPFSWNSVPDLEAGTFIAVGRDISEQKALQIELQRMDRLDLAGRVAMAISHEIRNPMTTVRGFLQLTMLREGDAKGYLTTMIEELDRANHIITEFLALARSGDTKKSVVELTAVVRRILPLVEAEYLMEGLQLDVNLQDTPAIPLDESEIKQLLLNLTKNAADVMRETGGTLTVSTYENNGCAVLEVNDQGTGIPEDVRPNIWTPFYTTKETGTGLGLSISHRIVQNHFGTINYVTGPEGTTFYVRFPPASRQK